MKHKQKGGLLLPYKNIEESEEIFRNFINNSNIKLLTNGTSGIILVADLQNEITKNYLKISPDENFGKPVKNIIIKLSIICHKDVAFKLSEEKDLNSITNEEFQNEINIQTDIYLKTIQYLQPLCPGIVYANITNNYDLLTILVRNSNNNMILANLENFLKRNSSLNLKLGIIGMEMLSSSVPLIYFKNQQGAMSLARYIVLKLALETGYNHNDFHYGNILIGDSENYFYNIRKRPFIIDFGRTTKINPDIMSNIKNEVNKKDYIKALKLLCHYNTGNEYTQDPEYNRHYGWICKNYNLDDPIYFDELAQNLLKIDPDNNLNSIKNKLNYSKSILKDSNTLINQNELIDQLFNSREKAIDNNIVIMDKLHIQSPDIYPLIPISTSIKNKLFSGIIGGKKKRKTKRYSKKNSRTKKRKN